MRQHPLLSSRGVVRGTNPIPGKADSCARQPSFILTQAAHQALLPALQAPIAARRQAVAIFDQLFPGISELQSHTHTHTHTHTHVQCVIHKMLVVLSLTGSHAQARDILTSPNQWQ
jgi:hypothetical protein